MKKLNGMGFNRFVGTVTGLVILLTITLLTMVYTFLQGHFKVTSFNLLIFALIECWYLIYYVRRTNRDLSRFFDTFQNNDTSGRFQDYSRDKSFRDLYIRMNSIIGHYSKIQQDREAQLGLIDYLLQQLPVGVLVFTLSDQVKMINRAFLNLLGINPFLEIHAMDTVKPGFSECLRSAKSGHQEILTINKRNHIIQASLKISDIKVGKEMLRMVVVQDVTAELQHAELESMQKMVRVLTHEMMNSSSPITLAAAGVIRQYEEMNSQEEIILSRELWQDHLTALQAIHKRSKGLTRFVEQYRQLVRFPLPVFELVGLNRLFFNLEVLLRDQLFVSSIQLQIEVVPENLTLWADEKMLEQVLLNLIKNSMEALSHSQNPYIRLTAVKIGERVVIQIEDNGCGIPDEIMDQIFTPMFTTKKEGTGVGLSLSRQIIHLHKGILQVSSQPGVKTIFTIRL